MPGAWAGLGWAGLGSLSLSLSLPAPLPHGQLGLPHGRSDGTAPGSPQSRHWKRPQGLSDPASGLSALRSRRILWVNKPWGPASVPGRGSASTLHVRSSAHTREGGLMTALEALAPQDGIGDKSDRTCHWLGTYVFRIHLNSTNIHAHIHANIHTYIRFQQSHARGSSRSLIPMRYSGSETRPAPHTDLRTSPRREGREAFLPDPEGTQPLWSTGCTFSAASLPPAWPAPLSSRGQSPKAIGQPRAGKVRPRF